MVKQLLIEQMGEQHFIDQLHSIHEPQRSCNHFNLACNCKSDNEGVFTSCDVNANTSIQLFTGVRYNIYKGGNKLLTRLVSVSGLVAKPFNNLIEAARHGIH